MSEDRRIRKTKTSIKSSLIDLLKTKPINQISVTELTSKADISRKTFYLHYNSIFEAKEDIDNDLIQRLKRLISTIISDAHKIEEKNILLFFKQVDASIREHKQLVDYFMMNSRQSSLYSKVKHLLKESVLEIVNSDSSDAVYNNYLAEFIVNGILSTYIEWNNRKRDISDEELNSLLTRLCASVVEMIK